MSWNMGWNNSPFPSHNDAAVKDLEWISNFIHITKWSLRYVFSRVELIFPDKWYKQTYKMIIQVFFSPIARFAQKLAVLFTRFQIMHNKILSCASINAVNTNVYMCTHVYAYIYMGLISTWLFHTDVYMHRVNVTTALYTWVLISKSLL